jgi:hypothetical protein
MNSNEYVHELGLDWNLEYIRALTLKQQYSFVEGLPRHHRRVKDDLYLSYLQSRYPCLSDVWNVYTFHPTVGVEPHVDGGRKCSLNIPVKNCQDSATIFYKQQSDYTYNYKEDIILTAISGTLEETWRFTLTEPVLFNNTLPHSVEVWGAEPRIIFSWTVKDLTFDLAKARFLDNQR